MDRVTRRSETFALDWSLPTGLDMEHRSRCVHVMRLDAPEASAGLPEGFYGRCLVFSAVQQGYLSLRLWPNKRAWMRPKCAEAYAS